MNNQNKIILGIVVLLVGFILLAPSLGVGLFSTQSFPDSQDSQCRTRESNCFFVSEVAGKLGDCHLGTSQTTSNKCFCEFQSYSRNECPVGSVPTNKVSSDTVVNTQGKVVEANTVNMIKDRLNTSLTDYKIPTNMLAIVAVILIIFLVFKKEK